MKDTCYLIYDKRSGSQNICISNKNLKDLLKDINKDYKIYDFKKINNSDSKFTSKELWFHIMKQQNSEPGIIELKGFSKNAWIIYFLENTHFILQNSSGEIRSSYAYRSINIPQGKVSQFLPTNFLNEYKYLEDKINLQIRTNDKKNTHLYSYYKNLDIKEKKDFIQEYQFLFNLYENKKDLYGLQILYHLFPDNKKSKKAFLRDFFPKDLIFLLVDLLEKTNNEEYLSLINYIINKDYYINQKEQERIFNSQNNYLQEVKIFLKNKELNKSNSSTKSNTKPTHSDTIHNQNFDRYKRTFTQSNKDTNPSQKKESTNYFFQEKSHTFVDLRNKKKNTFYRNYNYNYQHKYNVSQVKKDWQLNSLICGIFAIRNTKTNTIYIGESINIHDRWIQYYLDLHNLTSHNNKMQRDFNNYGIDILCPLILEEVEILANETYDVIKKHLIRNKECFISYFKNLGFTVYNIENNYDTVNIFLEQYKKVKVSDSVIKKDNVPQNIIRESYQTVPKSVNEEKLFIPSKDDVIKSFHIRLDSIIQTYLDGKTRGQVYDDYFNSTERAVFPFIDFNKLFERYFASYIEKNKINLHWNNKYKEQNFSFTTKFFISFIIVVFLFIILNKNHPTQVNNSSISNLNIKPADSMAGFNSYMINGEQFYHVNNNFLSKKQKIHNGFALKFLHSVSSNPMIISINYENCTKLKNLNPEAIIYISSTVQKIYEHNVLNLEFIAKYLCSNN